MRRKTLFIVLCLLSGMITLGGCGKESDAAEAETQESQAKEEDEWEEIPVAPIEKEDLKKIGVPLKGTVEIKLENNTGKSITGFAVKKSENSEFGENMLEDEDVYVKGEKRYFYYDYKQASSDNEDTDETDEAEDTTPEYDIQITYLNGTTAVLHDFPFDDMKEGALNLEDEITYLTYTSVKTKKEVDTKADEQSIKTKEEAAAAEAQRKADEAAAAEARRQAAAAAAAKQQAEAAAAEAQRQAQVAAEAQKQAEEQAAQQQQQQEQQQQDQNQQQTDQNQQQPDQNQQQQQDQNQQQPDQNQQSDQNQQQTPDAGTTETQQ